MSSPWTKYSNTLRVAEPVKHLPDAVAGCRLSVHALRLEWLTLIGFGVERFIWQSEPGGAVWPWLSDQGQVPW